MKVAVTEVAVHPVTVTSDDLILALPVKSAAAGKFVPVMVATLPAIETPVMVGEEAANCT